MSAIAATSDSEGRLGYRPALDGVRAIAITLVVVHHTIGFPVTGFFGVDMFFVLSGFLITTLLLEEHARRGGVSLRGFYRRRALRLLPALFTLLGVFFVIACIAAALGETRLDRALLGVAAGIGYFTNLVIAFGESGGKTALPNELGHLWSLAIEEQFYLVWPAVLLFLLRARLRLALVGLGAALVLITAQQVRLYLEGASMDRIAYGSDTRSTSIVVGCLLAVALLTAARLPLQRLARIVAPLGAASFLILLVADPGPRTFAPWSFAVALTSAWLVVLALDRGSLFGRTLAVPPLVFLGRISYALYLWHVPVYVTFRLTDSAEWMDIPALAISLACATASYYLVELRFLRRRHGPARPPVEGPKAVPVPA
jgi:peptidoglycan/LPS O-acetylase OafA/YrhL